MQPVCSRLRKVGILRKAVFRNKVACIKGGGYKGGGQPPWFPVGGHGQSDDLHPGKSYRGRLWVNNGKLYMPSPFLKSLPTQPFALAPGGQREEYCMLCINLYQPSGLVTSSPCLKSLPAQPGRFRITGKSTPCRVFTSLRTFSQCSPSFKSLPTQQ